MAFAPDPGEGLLRRERFYPNLISISNTIVIMRDIRQSSRLLGRIFDLPSSLFHSFRCFEFAPVKFKRGVAMRQ